ncbi:50S ribosomal protein L23 [Patescibacteria group bacterium]
MRISKIIIKPIVTEKTTLLAASENRYVFAVDVKASKEDIKKELKKLFNVDVVDIRTMVMPGKKKRIMKTRSFTKTSKWKKAIVRLKKDQKIDLFPKE